ncbi:MAG: hypothetical protein IKZ98_02430 [Clostridia bacterium]|nr:hypothetical protein [Clostridia bacterium]
MKRNEDFKKALGEPDAYFRQSVIDTLDQLNSQAEKKRAPQRKYAVRIALSFAMLVFLVLGGTLSGWHLTHEHDDKINPTPVVSTPLVSLPEASSVVETDLATLTFQEAERDNDKVRFTITVQPKHEHSVALSLERTLITTSESVADFYGIKPEHPENSLYSWVKDHNYEEALAVQVDSPYDGSPDPFYGDFDTEKHQVLEDGSAVMTIVGPAADDNVYDLEYHVVPWNMNNGGNSFLPELHEGGNIRLEISDTGEISVMVFQSLGFSVTETDLATLIIRRAVIKDYDLHLSVEVRPKHENSFVMTAEHFTSSNCQNASLFYGITADDPKQTLGQWIEAHGYQEFLRVSMNAPWGSDLSPFFTESCLQLENGSALMTIVTPAHTDSTVYELKWDVFAQALGTANNQSESRTITFDLSHMTITTLPPSDTPTVHTALADVTIQKAVLGGRGIYVNVEAVPTHENSLILNERIDPYADSPERIGKTPDYEGQSIMKWAVAHGYREVAQIHFMPDLGEMEPGVTYVASVTPPAFTATEEEHVEYRDDGTSIIRVVGISVPDQQVYRLKFYIHQWDMSKADTVRAYASDASTILVDTEVWRSIAFTVSELDEEPQVFAEYKSKPDQDNPEPAITVTLLHTSVFDCYDVRLPYEIHALKTDRYGVEHHYFMKLSYTDSPLHYFGKAGYVSDNRSISEEDDAVIYRCPWIFPDELPDELLLSDGVITRTLVRVR